MTVALLEMRGLKNEDGWMDGWRGDDRFGAWRRFTPSDRCSKIPVLCLHLQGASCLRHVAAGRTNRGRSENYGMRKADGEGRSIRWLRRLRCKDRKSAGGVNGWFLPMPVFNRDWFPDVAKVFTFCAEEKSYVFPLKASSYDMLNGTLAKDIKGYTETVVHWEEKTKRSLKPLTCAKSKFFFSWRGLVVTLIPFFCLKANQRLARWVS